MSAAGMYCSYTDPPLTNCGRSAARAWCTALAGVTGLHSPRGRTSETASLAGLNSSVCDELIEWDLGFLEGEPAEPYRQLNRDWMLFRDGAPGGEAPEHVLARALHVRAMVLGLSDEVVALVSHGQFAKTLATQILGLPIEFASKLSWGPGRAAVFSWRSSLNDYVLDGWNSKPTSDLNQLLSGNS